MGTKNRGEPFFVLGGPWTKDEESEMNLAELKEKANALPLKPGVYLMLDGTGRVIYVGKAKALKNA
jgi:hypothetical protein